MADAETIPQSHTRNGAHEARKISAAKAGAKQRAADAVDEAQAAADEAEQKATSAAQAAGTRGERAAAKAEGKLEKAEAKIEKAGERVTDATHDAADRVHDAADWTARSAASAQDSARTRSAVPIVAALGVAAALVTILRRRRRRSQRLAVRLVHQASEHAADARTGAKKAGRRMRSKAKRQVAPVAEFARHGVEQVASQIAGTIAG